MSGVVAGRCRQMVCRRVGGGACASQAGRGRIVLIRWTGLLVGGLVGWWSVVCPVGRGGFGWRSLSFFRRVRFVATLYALAKTHFWSCVRAFLRRVSTLAPAARWTPSVACPNLLVSSIQVERVPRCSLKTASSWEELQSSRSSAGLNKSCRLCSRCLGPGGYGFAGLASCSVDCLGVLTGACGAGDVVDVVGVVSVLVTPQSGKLGCGTYPSV
jgi:hypothetical protein